mmetsp:Transcript_72427/g.115508  ORF Transcript_72427/g.115508 Transcript_72427/m.115508 type:complete len:202 (+) Transcript_72427:1657-2262(+)
MIVGQHVVVGFVDIALGRRRRFIRERVGINRSNHTMKLHVHLCFVAESLALPRCIRDMFHSRFAQFVPDIADIIGGIRHCETHKVHESNVRDCVLDAVVQVLDAAHKGGLQYLLKLTAQLYQRVVFASHAVQFQNLKRFDRLKDDQRIEIVMRRSKRTMNATHTGSASQQRIAHRHIGRDGHWSARQRGFFTRRRFRARIG